METIIIDPKKRKEEATKLQTLNQQKIQENSLIARLIPDVSFTPIIWPSAETTSTPSWKVSTGLAWALRLADHEKDESTQADILKIIDAKPRFGTYILYQLLSSTYELDQETSGILDKTLNPISDELRERMVNSIVNTAEKLNSEEWGEPEKEMLDALQERSLANIDILGDISELDESTPLGDSYLTLKDWREIKNRTKKLRTDNPVISAIFTKIENLK